MPARCDTILNFIHVQCKLDKDHTGPHLGNMNDPIIEHSTDAASPSDYKEEELAERLRFETWYSANRKGLYRNYDTRLRMAIEDTARGSWFEGVRTKAAQVASLTQQVERLTAEIEGDNGLRASKDAAWAITKARTERANKAEAERDQLKELVRGFKFTDDQLVEAVDSAFPAQQHDIFLRESWKDSIDITVPNSRYRELVKTLLCKQADILGPSDKGDAE